MAHINLYRKYRPKTFSELIGQEHVSRTLINALKTDRTSHAYLFAGPRGTGKTSIAKILAKSLNCLTIRNQSPALGSQKKENSTPNPEPRTLNSYEPCGTCLNCTDIDNSSSVDVLEIDAASNRGIDEIRDLRERVHFAPAYGMKKVFIIDEVHMLTTEAFNALLKMIEEPPEHAVFILATTEVHKVIPTIVSRCQRFDFRRILVKDLVKRLTEIAKKEKISVDESTLAVIARQAQGSARDSIGLLDQLASFSDKKITSQILAQVLNLTESELLFEITDLILNKKTLECLKFVDRLMDRGFDLRQFATELIGHFRSITIALTAEDLADIIHTTPENLNRIKSQASRFQVFEAIKAIDLLSEVYHQMRYSADTRLLLEIALIKLTKLDSDLSLEGLFYRIEELEKATGHMPAKPKVKQTDVSIETTEKKADDSKVKLTDESSESKPVLEKANEKNISDFNEDKIKRIWPVIMQQVKKHSIPLYSLLLECHPKMNGNKLKLVFNRTASFHLKEVDKNSNLVKDALKKSTGTEVEIECVLDNVTIAKKESGQEQKSISADHAIELMKDSFGAEVVEKTTLGKEEE